MSVLRGGARIEQVPIASLLPGDSPRLAGEDRRHTRMLVESGAQLPPVLVHRGSMRVIDGMHRVSAAVQRGQDTIEVQFFDGSEQEAFVLAVRANMAHGLPLSAADRAAAAARIIASHPGWSDRAIAGVTGLAARTVRAIRGRISTDAVPAHRIGQDGRIRPLDGAAGRIRAAEVIARYPDASLREVAKLAGISPATARDVRQRVERGEDPVPPKQRPAQEHQGLQAGRAAIPQTLADQSPLALLHSLRNDPLLRLTESGREVLRWIFSRAVHPQERHDVVVKVPAHCTYLVADLARQFAEEWLQVADDLEDRARRMA